MTRSEPAGSAGLPAPGRLRLSPGTADRLIAAAALLLHLVSVRTGSHDDDPGAVADIAAGLLPFALALPLLRRRTRTVEVLAVITVAYLAYLVLVRPMTPFAVLAGVYAAGAYLADRTAMRVGATAIAVVAGAMAVRATTTDEGSLVDTVTNATLLVAALLVGWGVRARRSYTEALVERAAFLERERAQLDEAAAVTERLRIARELHDVAAHGISLIAMRASSARLALQDGQPAAALPDVELVERTSRASLTELRRLLTVLRSDSDAELAPSPGLADIAEIDAGVAVSYDIDVGRDVPAGIELTAYRLVQEALTNVRRHAAAATATVTIREAGDVLAVDVRDDGTGQPAEPGFGLLGMQERVAVYGGTLTAGPDPAGGWRVSARIPVDGRAS